MCVCALGGQKRAFMCARVVSSCEPPCVSLAHFGVLVSLALNRYLEMGLTAQAGLKLTMSPRLMSSSQPFFCLSPSES